SLSWCSTVVPALRALTPPTIWVPALSMSAVCLVPSPPVMPWTMTLESLLRKIDMFFQSLRGERGCLVGAVVHGGGDGHERVVGGGENRAPLLHLVAVETHDERLGGGVAEHLEGLHDAVRDGDTRGDAAEHVHEHALDLLVTEDHIQAVRHHLSGCATADVEEVGGLHTPVGLAGVGDDVERRHDEARPVADDADLAVEL